MSEKLQMAKATLESSRPRRVLVDKGVPYAAERLGCSVANVYRLVAAGELPAVDVGCRTTGTRRRPTLRFLDEDLDAFITERRSGVQAVAEEPAPRVLQLVGKDRYR